MSADAERILSRSPVLLKRRAARQTAKLRISSCITGASLRPPLRATPRAPANGDDDGALLAHGTMSFESESAFRNYSRQLFQASVNTLEGIVH